jgi:1,4-dihydroxy-2-naphthoate octaprenyltransferase
MGVGRKTVRKSRDVERDQRTEKNTMIARLAKAALGSALFRTEHEYN